MKYKVDYALRYTVFKQKIFMFFKTVFWNFLKIIYKNLKKKIESVKKKQIKQYIALCGWLAFSNNPFEESLCNLEIVGSSHIINKVYIIPVKLMLYTYLSAHICVRSHSTRRLVQ